MNKELKENIMQGTLQAFNQKGLKFTMDDIAKILGISKNAEADRIRDELKVRGIEIIDTPQGAKWRKV